MLTKALFPVLRAVALEVTRLGVSFQAENAKMRDLMRLSSILR